MFISDGIERTERGQTNRLESPEDPVCRLDGATTSRHLDKTGRLCTQMRTCTLGDEERKYRAGQYDLSGMTACTLRGDQ